MSDLEDNNSKKSGSGQGSSSSNMNHEVGSTNIRLPPYFPNSLNSWFIQIESQFTIGRIKNDVTRYNYLISALPQDVCESLLDVLEKPPETDLYENLKKTIISRHSLSIERRIKKLISDADIGDSKPSEFYRRLKVLAGNSGTVGDELIKNLWLSRLPNLINIALIPQMDSELSKILDTADKIFDSMQSSSNVSAIVKPKSSENCATCCSSNSDVKKLEKEISELKRMFKSFNFNRNRSRSRSRSKPRDKSLDKQHNCWYHHKFGVNAQKCISPCNFKNSPSTSNSKN